MADRIAYPERTDRIVIDDPAGLGERASEPGGPDAGPRHAALQAEPDAAFPDDAGDLGDGCGD